MRKVVVTGIGLIAPTGVGVDSFWSALLEGRSAVGPVTRFDATNYPCRVAGEILDRSYEELIEPKKLRVTTLVSQLALAAGELALRDAHLSVETLPSERVGVMIGTALGGMQEGEQQMAILRERGARRVNPFIANGAPHYAPAAELASAIGGQGEQLTFSSGCSASTQAIGHGAALVARGELDICLAGGTEAPIMPLVFAGMCRTLELSTNNDPPERASRPFDRSHSGMVLSEGGCVLLLEASEHAAARGTRAYAEIAGYACSSDANGLYHFDPSGEAGARAIHRALMHAQCDTDDVDYVCAHANSSPAFDRKETLVLKRAFGEAVGALAISSIKAILGHPFGASGAFQVAASCVAMRQGVIPPTHHLEQSDCECDLDYVPLTPRRCSVRTALVTSYGYGGINAYLVLRA